MSSHPQLVPGSGEGQNLCEQINWWSESGSPIPPRKAAGYYCHSIFSGVLHTGFLSLLKMTVRVRTHGAPVMRQADPLPSLS